MKDFLERIVEPLSLKETKEQRKFLTETRVIILSGFFRYGDHIDTGEFFYLKSSRLNTKRALLSFLEPAKTGVDTINFELKMINNIASMVKLSRVTFITIVSLLLAGIIIVKVFT